MIKLNVFITIISGLMIAGCSATDINTELPSNHPANPATEESEFVLPPNPFTDNLYSVEPNRPPGMAGNHKRHREDQMHQHGMQKMKPESEAPDDSQKDSTEHQH